MAARLHDARRRDAGWSALDATAQMLDRLGLACIVTDDHGAVRVWNAAATALYGWTWAEVVGRPILELNCGPRSQQQAAEIMTALRAGLRWEGRFEAVCRDGTPVQIQVANTPLLDPEGEVWAVLGVSFEPVSGELTLADHGAELVRSLSRARVDAREQVAALVHDRIGQPIATARSLAAELLDEPGGAPHAAPLVDALDEAADGLVMVLEGLDPVERDLGTLAELLERLPREAAGRAGWRQVDVNVAAELSDARWPGAVTRALHDTLVRGVANIERHAQATQVRIRLQRRHDLLVLELDDDGVGPGDARLGFGLQRLRRDVEALGGSLRLADSPLGGAVLELAVPLGTTSVPDHGLRHVEPVP